MPRFPEAIETLRLHLRPFTAADARVAFGWLGDPVVMRFIPSSPDRSVAETRKRLATYIEHQARHGFSKWLVEERASGQPIGDAGLLVLAESGKIDLGFRFARPYWGKGFATEVAAAWIRAAFGDFGLARITAFVHPQNTASVRVLEKVHFRALGRDQVLGSEHLTFALDAAEFRALTQTHER